MIPSWIINTLVIILGCILAIYFGSALPEFDMLGAYLVGLLIVCTICLVTNNFPALMAVAIWYPFAAPIPFFRAFPTFALVLGWFALVLFFKLCMDKSLTYIRSFNWWLLLCFAWVPVRFLINPVHKLGAQVGGGQGVSGVNAYFLYALAGITVVVMGFILTDRKKIISFLRWSFWLVLIDGVAFLICAFIPATGPFLASMGMFAAGNLTDGILRIVVLPGYGLFLIQAVLCPRLFQLSRTGCALIFALGMVMIIVGGNRQAVAAAVISAPVILLLRRQFTVLAVSGTVFLLMLVGLNLWLHTMNDSEIPGLARSFGIFSSKIDEASGGNASAEWRYAVWQSGVDKIMEAPIIGKGFGNLDQRLQADAEHKLKPDETDFEIILASGEAHNGFISAAYGFGIPFMIALSLGLFWRTFVHMRAAWRTTTADWELRDFHAYIAGTLAAYPILIYTAFDLCSTGIWVAVALGLMMERLTQSAKRMAESSVLHTNMKARSQGAVLLGSISTKTLSC